MAYGDDNVAMLGDDEASLFGLPEPIQRQLALSENVRRNPALAMPTGGVPSRSSFLPLDPRLRGDTSITAPTAPMAAAPSAPTAPGPKPGTSAYTLSLLGDRLAQKPDVTELVQYAKQRDEEANRKFMLGLVMRAKGGSAFGDVGGQVLKQALAEQGDYEIPGGWGRVHSGGVVWNPAKLQEAETTRLEARYRAELAAEQRAEAAREANLTREAIAASKDPKTPRMQRTPNVTLDGQPVTFNPEEGQHYVGGQPYSGPMMSQHELDKQVHATQQALATEGRTSKLLDAVKANPQAFGGIASLAPYTGNWAGQRINERALTPQQRQIRGAVLREAAMVIHDLYGAAVTAGEERRANTFAVTPQDPPEVVMDKLQIALNWAAQQKSIYGPRIGRIAANRSGVAAPAAPGAGVGEPPPGAVRPKGGS